MLLLAMNKLPIHAVHTILLAINKLLIIYLVRLPRRPSG